MTDYTMQQSTLCLNVVVFPFFAQKRVFFVGFVFVSFCFMNGHFDTKVLISFQFSQFQANITCNLIFEIQNRCKIMLYGGKIAFFFEYQTCLYFGRADN